MPRASLRKGRQSDRSARDCGGAPRRAGLQRTFHLQINEWGQIVYNGRFSDRDEGSWWYEKKVVNVGLFERLIPSMFISEAPTYRYEAMAHLF